MTLILFNSINSTAGPEFHIGSARLGGFNGIPGIPPLNLPFSTDWPVDLEGMFYLSTASLILVYFGLKALLASRFGRVIVGIRENERRAELLGYDPRAYKLATFVIGAALAGYAGCLFANWGAFVSPTIFGLAQSAQIIIWVIVGGRGTLIGPILGCVGIQWLTAALGANAPTGGGRLGGAARQRAADPRRDPGRLRAARAQGLRADARPISAALPPRGRRADERAAAGDARARHALRRRAGGARRQFRAGGARAALSDRPQRRRQEHLLQDADRAVAADLGHGAVSRRGHFAQGAA